MVQQVTGWVTDRGEFFETKAEAIASDSWLNLKDHFDKFRGGSRSGGASPEDVVRWLRGFSSFVYAELHQVLVAHGVDVSKLHGAADAED
jgi:hypothetical protein